MKTAEKPSVKLKVFEIALLAGLAVFFLTGSLALRAQDRLADKVVRLHVLANSDSEEDQALKLLVRDQVLERAASLWSRPGTGGRRRCSSGRLCRNWRRPPPGRLL